MLHAALDRPSDWVVRWADRVPADSPVLDVACGGGRHARFFAARGHTVDAVDRDTAALVPLKSIPLVTALCSDIESGPWPYTGSTFGGVIVTNYLHRPLMPMLLDAVALGGVLIYETFAIGNERYGRPANPDFLLQPGELLDLVRSRLRVIAYEDLYVEKDVDRPKPAMIQRICAVRERA